jgi:hypothetical protein
MKQLLSLLAHLPTALNLLRLYQESAPLLRRTSMEGVDVGKAVMELASQAHANPLGAMMPVIVRRVGREFNEMCEAAAVVLDSDLMEYAKRLNP